MINGFQTQNPDEDIGDFLIVEQLQVMGLTKRQHDPPVILDGLQNFHMRIGDLDDGS